MKIKIKKVYLGVDICVIITYISIKLNKPMEKQMYKYIVIAKEWRDKVNGNSYFSAQIESTEDGSKTKLPFQYGYGDQYKYEAVRELVKEGLLEETKEYPFVPVKFVKIPNTLKREAVSFGEV